MHDRPVESLLGRRRRRSGEHVVVGLRPADSEHPSKSALELILHLELLFWRRPGAAPVQHQDRVLDVAARCDCVDALGHSILAAFGRTARFAAQQEVGDRAVAVIDDGNLFGSIVVTLHVRGEDQARGAEVCVGAADLLVQRAPVGEHHRGGWDVPHACGRSNHCIGGRMIDGCAQIARIGKVARLRRVPHDRLAATTGKVRRPSHPARPTGYCRPRGRQERCQQQQHASRGEPAAPMRSFPCFSALHRRPSASV